MILTRLSIFIILLSFACLSSRSFAQQVRTSFSGGLGDSVATSASGSKSTRKESPGAFAVTIDFPLYGPFFIFAEHFRSFGSSGTSLGFTGAGIKFYPWINPRMTKNINGMESSQISIQGFLPYFGLGVGFAQASIISNETQDDVLAAGLYISAKAGAEFVITDRWGLISEWNYGNAIVGSGSIEAVNLLFGAYLKF